MRRNLVLAVYLLKVTKGMLMTCNSHVDALCGKLTIHTLLCSACCGFCHGIWLSPHNLLPFALSLTIWRRVCGCAACVQKAEAEYDGV